MRLVLVVAAVCVCAAFASAAPQQPRLFWAEVELVGPLERVAITPLRGGDTVLELDLVDGERRVLEVPVPLYDLVDLDFGDGPSVTTEETGSARFVRWSAPPRFAGVPRVLSALPRPTSNTRHTTTPWPAWFVVVAATLVVLLLAAPTSGRAANQRVAAHTGVGRAPIRPSFRTLWTLVAALLGALACALAVRAAASSEPRIEVVDRLVALDGSPESPRLVQRAVRGTWRAVGDWRGVLEVEPAGAPLFVAATLDEDGLRFEVDVPRGHVVVLEAALPHGASDDPLAIPRAARRTWRDGGGAWWSVTEDGELAPGTAPQRAFAAAGLPQGKPALVAELGDRWWRVLDLPRERAGTER